MATVVSSASCDPTGRSCVWRTSAGLKKLGSHIEPHDLCIAITDESSGPCGRKAQVFLGSWYDEAEEEHRLGQPFCRTHAHQILDASKEYLMRDAKTSAEFKAKEKVELVAAKRRIINRNQPTYVYFAFIEDRLKIGLTMNPKRRLSSLETQMGSRFDRVILIHGQRKEEQRLHRKFKSHRLLGEWFTAHQDIVQYVSTLKPCSVSYP